ncbi:MAG: DUF5103 domain-containing protein [Flavobacterium sp. BFFFF2]|nr:MAG: DUF5103 domain-containing protein [Flavobacterium sp. BFFFF2]
MTIFKFVVFTALLFFVCPIMAQDVENELAPPFNIKTVSFVQNSQNVVPVFKWGDVFEFQFDDLFGNEANYYYTITHCDYNWRPSNVAKSEYLAGMDDQRIQDYANSYTTLQLFSHYKLAIPNRFTTGLKLSGNYILKILNDEHEPVFSRKFMVYEDRVNVPIQVKRARQVKDINLKHNLDFSILPGEFALQNPLSNIKILIMQNGQLPTAIKNIKPMYTVGNDLIYKYDTETQFWAGNEFLNFENKNIRAATNNVAYMDTNGGVYNVHLLPNKPRGNSPYTFFPDINGNYKVTNINSTNPELEADYSWVFFNLDSSGFTDGKDVYINGMFNNYALTPDNKMDYNEQTKRFEKAIMLKQGFTNYQYVLADKKGKIDYENALDGNFFQTENNYFVLVYYRENGQRFDRIIGSGTASSVDIIN